MSTRAFTSKVGYYTQSRYFTSEWGPRYQDWDKLSQVYNGYEITGYSNKGPTIKSDGVTPTPYFRKIGNITSRVAPRVETSSHRWKADSSIGLRGISLYGVPHGTAYSNPSVSLPQWMTDKVIQDCMSDIQDIRANLMEDFAQVNQTVGLLWGLFATIVKLFIMMRKRQWRKIRRLLRGFNYKPSRKISSAWLAYYYGIKPLVSTMDALCQTAKPRQRIVSATRRVRQPVDPMDFVRFYLSGIASGAKAEMLAVCGLKVAVNTSSTLSYWQSLGFTGMFANDAVVTAWALTPWSFVVDWILPVERFLRSRTWGSGIAYQNGYVSKVLRCNGTFRATNSMTGLGDSGDMPVVQVDALLFQRTAYNLYTPPSGLALNLSLTSTQAINALALITQRRT